MRRRRLSTALILLALLTPAIAGAQRSTTAGDACTSSEEGNARAYWDNFLICSSSVWTRQPVHIGDTSLACASTGAGLVRWTGSGFEGCNGSSWANLATSTGLTVFLGTGTGAANPRISGDATTGLASLNTKEVTIVSGGSVMMRVTTVGVGIGASLSAQPATVLDVNGESTFTTTANNIPAIITQQHNANVERNVLTLSRIISDSTSPTTAMIGSVLFKLEGVPTGNVLSAGAIKWSWETNQTGTTNNDRDSYLAFGTMLDNSLTERLRITSTGSVGMNTTTPGYPLQIGSDSSNGNGAYLTPGGVWVDVSDMRVKTDIEPIAYGMAQLKQLRPIHYRLQGSGVPQIGFIAQEVESIVPEVVTRPNNPEGRYGLSYGQLTALIVKATQQLDSRMRILAALVAILFAAVVALGLSVRRLRRTERQQFTSNA